MATTQVSPDLPKPSFAKVAASVNKDNATPASVRRIATPSKEQPMNPTKTPKSTGPVIANGGSGKPAIPQFGNAPVLAVKSSVVDRLTGSLNDLSLGPKAPSLVVNGSGSLPVERLGAIAGRESASDDSQKADSSSELGTKPPSLDGKSITSGTTFALDEKESLRPDDSASVKAAAEDDDAFSVRGSLVAGSRMGSEVAARARGIPLGDIPERRLPPAPGISIQGVLTPQSTSSEQPSGPSSSMPLGVGGSSDALNVIYRQAPDDKLLEAMSSPKDRLFLLRLEKQVIEFVQDSKEPYMDLPPSNSFCRMLTHKLADYYHMTHSYEPHVGSVRIFRTPFCRVPTSLALMNPNPSASASSTPPPAVLPKKIMRRGQDSEGGPSASPSKATSETGSDGKEKVPAANQKLTREEREEMYKLARERIFGSSEESIAENEGDNGVSRTSSISTKDKSNLGKRGKTGKQRRDDSDSFDSRNQYTPYWGPQQQTWIPQPQYMSPPNPQYSAQAPPPPTYQGQVAPGYGQQGPGFPAMPSMIQSQPYPQYVMPPYQPPPTQKRYPSAGSPMATYGIPAPPVAPQQTWQQGFSPAPYQPRTGPAPAGPPGPPGQPGIPYAFGQLPANANPHDPKSQHPIPGSYNRNHAFNPKTQSFVPGGNGMPLVPAPQPPFTAPGSHHGSPQVGSPHLAYPGYQQPMPPYGGGFGMARQGSSNSMPAYHTPQHVNPVHVQQLAPPPLPQNPQHMPAPNLPQNPSAHILNRPNIPQGPSQTFTHLPTYGNPATLPQKPATGI
ncbi:Fc.00g100420.m01.CDS01 [Cosmosporella sp. VM-42]